MDHLSIPNCSQCGSPLILISRVTESLPTSRFPQTTSIYRCSNDECQAEKDKQEAKRLKLNADKAEATKKRLEEKEQAKLEQKPH